MLICSSSRDTRYLAEDVYSKVYEKSLKRGLFTDLSLLDWMRTQSLWTDEQEDILQGIEKDIDSLKVGLFETGLILSKSKIIKDTIKSAKVKYKEYYVNKHRFDHLTASYNAGMAKLAFLIKNSITTLEGKEIRVQNLLKIINHISDSKIRDEDFRELARTEPWNSIFSISNKPFNTPAIDMTDEQKSLLCWSMLYSNIKKHPECPSDIILADDDATDGWLITQRNKYDKDIKKRKISDILSNEKIRNAEEVFVMVDNPEDAKIVEDLNDPLGIMRKKQREAVLSEKGEVNEVDMPDTKQRINMEINKMRSGDG